MSEDKENNKEPLPKELLETLIIESQLLDDHGSVIIGERTSKYYKDTDTDLKT